MAISRLVTRIFYGVRVSDPHNGYRVFTIPALQQITLEADGMHYANELNEQIWIHKLKVGEVYIRYTQYSLSKGQKNSNSIKLGFEMLYKKFLG